MPATLPQQILSALSGLTGQYHQLLIVVGLGRTGKSAALTELGQRHGLPPLNINLALATRIHDLTKRQRRLRAAVMVEDAIAEHGGDVVFLDNIEMMFHPDLALDPLALLQSLARTRTVVAAWRGQYRNGILTYSEPSHPEHRSYDHPPVPIVTANVGLTSDPSAGTNQAPSS